MRSSLRRFGVRAAVGAVSLALTASALAAAPTAAASTPAHDVTSATEARRVDGVPAPKLTWFDCFPDYESHAQCATTYLPLDYDNPKGPKTEIALARIKAADPAHRIGTLFVNPGGPGGSAVDLAAVAPYFLGQDVLDRFDIVGVDPRGVGFGGNVKCFPNSGVQSTALAGMEPSFPWTGHEKRAWIASSKALAAGCGTTGRPLAASMSTAEVARDMDVIRRTLGDRKLTYLGFSYGTQLGQVYANLFPDRVRAVVIDGVLDPVAWTGTAATAGRPVTDRIRSADGASKALREFLTRCGTVGEQSCSFAKVGDPVAGYATLAKRLQDTPIVINDPDFGDFTITYAAFVGATLGQLYNQEVGSDLADFFTEIWDLSSAAASPATRAAASHRAAAQLNTWREARTARGGYAFPYDNSLETFTAVLCSDSRNPQDPGQWIDWARRSDARAPYFGSAWLWGSSPCANSIWTARDEDRYMGPFTRRTVNPVLVVGDYYDPATNYAGAVAVSKLLPNSRLLSSNSWGHTAYGTSACATDAIEKYLLSKALPKAGTVCVGPQPFEVAPNARAGSGKPAPITPFIPPTLAQP